MVRFIRASRHLRNLQSCEDAAVEILQATVPARGGHGVSEPMAWAGLPSAVPCPF